MSRWLWVVAGALGLAIAVAPLVADAQSRGRLENTSTVTTDRVDFGAGANDYLISDGTNIEYPGNLDLTGSTGTITWTGSGRAISDNGTAINNNNTWSSTIGSGSNAFQVNTNGARIDFGAGANDYASSDGTVVTFAGPLGTAGEFKHGTASAQGVIRTQVDDTTASPTTCAEVIAPSVAYATGDCATSISNSAGTQWIRFYEGGVFSSNASIGTPASGTGITAVYSGAVRPFVHKVTVINTALTAAATTDITLHTTPVNTRIIRITADVTQVFTGGTLSAMTVQCGNSAGGNQYLLANSVFTAVNTWGDVAAEIGAGLLSATVADMGTSAGGVPGAITVQCRFTCTGANCNAATQGSVTFYVEGVTY